MLSKLDQLRSMTVVVADTGDLEAVRLLKPQDCTTNPSLVLKAMQNLAMADFVDEVIATHRGLADVSRVIDDLTVGLGVELSRIVPGRVSIEVDANLSFDPKASFAKAMSLITAFQRRGVSHDRILIKLASTWEGIQAAARLQREGIDCNLTLVFSLAQARACADAGAFLISPFVGRITDWHSKATGKSYAPEEDPGVLSVRRIYDHYKQSGVTTVVMGASFRTTGQIEALAGCDRLTISPELLARLADDKGTLNRRLLSDISGSAAPIATEPQFRWEMNEDAMATEKLAEGIRNFNADAVKLALIVQKRMAA